MIAESFCVLTVLEYLPVQNAITLQQLNKKFYYRFLPMIGRLTPIPSNKYVYPLIENPKSYFRIQCTTLSV